MRNLVFLISVIILTLVTIAQLIILLILLSEIRTINVTVGDSMTDIGGELNSLESTLQSEINGLEGITQSGFGEVVLALHNNDRDNGLFLNLLINSLSCVCSGNHSITMI